MTHTPPPTGLSLYERMDSTPEGSRALAVARLRREARAALWEALDNAGLTTEQLAERLGVSPRAVNRVLGGNGNISIDTVATWLHALGREVVLEVVEAGEPRRRAIAAATLKKTDHGLD